MYLEVESHTIQKMTSNRCCLFPCFMLLLLGGPLFSSDVSKPNSKFIAVNESVLCGL